MSTLSFRMFFFFVFASFLFAWFGLIVLPWVELGHLAPIKEEGGSAITPWDATGLAPHSERV